MKKRRTIIISFLLLATLVMGVGYAAVADTLNITGRASFRPASLVAGEVASAIKFDKTFGTNGATPHLSFDDDITHVTASVVEDNEAALTLVINDTTTLEDYTVTVSYKVMYNNKTPPHSGFLILQLDKNHITIQIGKQHVNTKSQGALRTLN